MHSSSTDKLMDSRYITSQQRWKLYFLSLKDASYQSIF
ncbi:hypothetical protein T08_8276 [Trichinella sp. T8]|nr:hypothetical protein T08_8276 [Trichinella sp. T8]